MIRRLFLFVWLPLVGLFLAYVSLSYRATGFDPAVLISDARTVVSDDADRITFAPRQAGRAASLIFIPGSMVEPTAYAPLARSLADQGYAVVVVKLPLRSVPLEAQRQSVVARVADLIRSGGREQRWVVAGHSLGGCSRVGSRATTPICSAGSF